MMGKTHKVGGVCGGILSILVVNSKYITTPNILIIPILIGSYIGSLLPDIDHKKSTLGKKFTITSTIINKTFGHRGITHAPLVNIVLTAILMSLNTFIDYKIRKIYILFIMGLFIGISSHIFLDSLNIEGIPIFYPFSNKKYSLLKIKVNSHEEFIQAIMILLTILAIVYK